MKIVRQTKSVKMIFSVFKERKTPISTLELIKRFNGEMNKSTVYRILERLENANKLYSFLGKDGVKWYAVCDSLNADNMHIHPHFQCSVCGKIECLPIDIAIPKVEHHTIESVSLLLSGKCFSCAS